MGLWYVSKSKTALNHFRIELPLVGLCKDKNCMSQAFQRSLYIEKHTLLSYDKLLMTCRAMEESVLVSEWKMKVCLTM